MKIFSSSNNLEQKDNEDEPILILNAAIKIKLVGLFLSITHILYFLEYSNSP